jgi:hypothetical protein
MEEKKHLAQQAQRGMRSILNQAEAVADSMGMSRGTLLLMLAVGALTAEEKDSKDIQAAVDFVAAGLAAKLGDLEF